MCMGRRNGSTQTHPVSRHMYGMVPANPQGIQILSLPAYPQQEIKQIMNIKYYEEG